MKTKSCLHLKPFNGVVYLRPLGGYNVQHVTCSHEEQLNVDLYALPQQVASACPEDGVGPVVFQHFSEPSSNGNCMADIC